MNLINPTEQDERQYLDKMLQQLEEALRNADRETRQFSKEFREDQAYLRDQRSGMDEADVVSAGQSFKRMAHQGESGIATRRKLTRMSDTPWFGRIDFIPHGRKERLPIYIGMYSFIGDTRETWPIYDWRAPVSSMFYDFELGDAWYKTPAGVAKGEIELRRQYRIRKGKMDYMIENSVNIQDDLLQRELSHASDDKMKQIVATIQRDQNAIIRNDTSQVMIIQGVAGSGKTSIAIHRIAFLLYRFRDELASKDILILSSNKVFADYISNVLPELGEAQIPEMGIEELAADLLDHKFNSQTFLQQVFTILQTTDEGYIERIRFKSTAAFITQLNRYLIHLENNWFNPVDIQVGNIRIPSTYVRERFNALQRVPLLGRVAAVAEEVKTYARTTLNRKLSGHEKSVIHETIMRSVTNANVLDLYRGFYEWIERPDLFRMGNNVLEYADVFPLIYCKMRLEGIQPLIHVKHLVIDEMQDYTPIQYAVLVRLFQGNMTILGDASQTANPYSASNAEVIQKVFPQADVVKLMRSYRSTWEITRFTQMISPNADLVAMERHGAEPEVTGYSHEDEEETAIRERVDRFRVSDFHMLAIICKTPSQAEDLFSKMKAPDVYLLNEETTFFREGVIITTAPMAKGLEFDEVIVPYVSDSNYRNEVDRSMLYIACTRAMHKLTVTYSGEISGFLKSKSSN